MAHIVGRDWCKVVESRGEISLRSEETGIVMQSLSQMAAVQAIRHAVNTLPQYHHLLHQILLTNTPNTTQYDTSTEKATTVKPEEPTHGRKEQDKLSLYVEDLMQHMCKPSQDRIMQKKHQKKNEKQKN